MAFGFGLDADESGVGGDEELIAVGTSEGAVAGAVREFDTSEMLSIWRDDHNAMRGGGPEIAVYIDCHTVERETPTGLDERGEVEEDLFLGERAVGLFFEYPKLRAVGFFASDVKFGFVG